MKTVHTVCYMCVCALLFLCAHACVLLCVCVCVLMPSSIWLCWGQHSLYAHWKSQGFWLNKNPSREWKGLECLIMLSWPLDSCRLLRTCLYGPIWAWTILYIVIMEATGTLSTFKVYLIPLFKFRQNIPTKHNAWQKNRCLPVNEPCSRILGWHQKWERH